MDAARPSSGRPEALPTLRPPQFRLRTLLLLVAVCCFIFAVSRWLSPAAAAGLAFLTLSIFCHVAGNAIGTRLRQVGDQKRGGSEPTSPIRRVERHEFAPATHLSQRRGLGWLIVIVGLAGLIAGGFAGGVTTLLHSSGPVDPANVLIGVVAYGTLGGMASFLLAGFAQVLGSAIWQATYSSANQHALFSPESHAAHSSSAPQHPEG